MMCSAAFVHPILFFSKENKSWYLVRRLHACLAVLESQDSNPDKSNFSKSICCLSSSDICPTSLALTGLELKSAWGIILAVTILAMGTPFWTSTHSLVLFSQHNSDPITSRCESSIGAKNFDSHRKSGKTSSPSCASSHSAYTPLVTSQSFHEWICSQKGESGTWS